MNYVAIEKSLSEVSEIADINVLTETQVESLVSLLTHEGFRVLLGLLLAEKYGAMQMLMQMDLSDGRQAHAASVLQGRIKGVDAPRNTLLELANYFTSPTDGDNNA
jgi:hypothetical protein